MRQKILDSLASESEDMDLDHSIQLLEKLRSSNLYSFGNEDIKGVLDSVLEICQTMRTGGTPNVKHMAGNAFMQKVLNRLPWFFSYTSGAGATKTKTRGAAAIPLYMQSLTSKKNENTLNFDDLHMAHIYAFMLDPTQNESIAALTTHLMEGVATGTKRRKVIAASSSRAPPANDKKKKKTKQKGGADGGEDSVMALFG